MHVWNTGQSGHSRHSRHRKGLLGIFLALAISAGTADANPAPSLADISAGYQQSMDAGLYGEAIDAQKRYIGILLSEPDHSRLEWGRALDRLARAQLEAEIYDEAIENFELAVDVIEEETNRLDAELAEPLVGLAKAQLGAENLDDSLVTFKRVIHVQQVNYGPHALAQAEVLDQMSRIALELGDYDAANGYKQAYVSVYRQNFEDDYLKQVDALLGQAELLARTGHSLDAQYAYRRIIADVEDAAGRRSLALLPAIYQFADLMQNYAMSDGLNGGYTARRYLRRAMHIAEKSDDATALDRANAYVAYGDYLSVFAGDGVGAMRYYRQAWDELSEAPEYAAERKALFARPVLLNPVPGETAPVMVKVLRLSTEQDAGSANRTRLAASFDIDERGDARNIAIVEGDPTGYMDPILTRHIELFVFRPGFIDAEPAEFKNQMFVVEYTVPDGDPDLVQTSSSFQAGKSSD